MQANVRSIIFQALNEVECVAEEKEIRPDPDGVILETHYSCISAGTEIAKLTGLQPFPYPSGLGNRAIGRVVETGPECKDFAVGDLVFSHIYHVSHAKGARLVAKLPDELDRPDAALIGMITVAITGVRQVNTQIGDFAVVTGAGLVGIFAAQLLELSGVTTVIVDQVEGRLEKAKECGISHAVNFTKDDPVQLVMDITGGEGVDYLLECTGNPKAVEGSPDYMAKGGTIVMVGSPRGEYPTDLVPFIERFHLHRPHGDLTLKGAHEWKTPMYPDGFHKISMQRNVQTITRLIQSGKLKTRELLSKVYKPEKAAQAYKDLIENMDETLGAVFDWRE